MTERDTNIICGVIVSSFLDFNEKERLCALVRAAASPSGDGARQPQECAFMEKVCPFCGENDFDAWGLKFHLSQGGCGVYNETTREKRDGD